MNKNLIFSLAAAVILSLLLTNCVGLKKADTQTITIASQQMDCHGPFLMKCMLVKYQGDSDWSLWYGNIEGFEYEQGYEYVIRIKSEDVANPPADASSKKHTLVEIVSQVEKTSEALPEPRPENPEPPTPPTQP